MTHYFLDSSALIKRYVNELGTSWIRGITATEAGHVIVGASITPVEVVSGIMRLKREGALDESAARAIRVLADRHAGDDYFSIGLTEETIEQAEDILEKYALRASDSIQLALALRSRVRLALDPLTSLMFVSSDSRLLAAAAAEGLPTIDPNDRA